MYLHVCVSVSFFFFLDWGISILTLDICILTLQVVLISATLPNEILEITSKFMTDPVRILVKRDELTLEASDDLNFSMFTHMPTQEMQMHCHNDTDVLTFNLNLFSSCWFLF